jgi:hypothetical protein
MTMNKMESVHESLTRTGLPNRDKSNQAITFHNIQMSEQQLEHEQKLQASQADRSWRSCCFIMEKDSTVHFTKLFISIMVISLCGYQLISLTDCSSQHMYSAILGLILGHWTR